MDQSWELESEDRSAARRFGSCRDDRKSGSCLEVTEDEADEALRESRPI